MHAILLKNGTVKLASGRAHFNWLHFRGGKRASKVRYDTAGNYSIETVFSGTSYVMDGPHLWWRVTVTKHQMAAPSRPPADSGLLGALGQDLANKCSSIDELFKSASGMFRRSFAIVEEATEEHMSLLKRVRAEVRCNDKMRRPELSEILLSKLGYWCEQGWGRQTETAKAIGVTSQRVNDWITGRKKMTGEQALRLQNFLQRQRPNPIRD
jgi:hypothetical protein